MELIKSIHIHKYKLTPLVGLNRFDQGCRSGVLLCINEQYYLDYHPWVEFGDLQVEEFLGNLKIKKILPDFLLRDLAVEKKQNRIKIEGFYNHIFYKKVLQTHSHLTSSVFKIKYLGDLVETLALCNQLTKHGNVLRIDFNNALNMNSIIEFWNGLENKKLIEYIEDPCLLLGNNWSELSRLGIPLACDRNIDKKKEVLYRILKPNRDVFSDNNERQKCIFSNYMGHDLGMYHCFLHLMEKGDLGHYHGIHTPSIYQEQMEIFSGKDGKIKLNLSAVENMYKKIQELKWTNLI